jgi:hypothetical protein
VERCSRQNFQLSSDQEGQVQLRGWRNVTWGDVQMVQSFMSILFAWHPCGTQAFMGLPGFHTRLSSNWPDRSSSVGLRYVLENHQWLRYRLQQVEVRVAWRITVRVSANHGHRDVSTRYPRPLVPESQLRFEQLHPEHAGVGGSIVVRLWMF